MQAAKVNCLTKQHPSLLGDGDNVNTQGENETKVGERASNPSDGGGEFCKGHKYWLFNRFRARCMQLVCLSTAQGLNCQELVARSDPYGGAH